MLNVSEDQLKLAGVITNAVRQVAVTSGGTDVGKSGYCRLFHQPDGAPYYDFASLFAGWAAPLGDERAVNFGGRPKYELVSADKIIRMNKNSHVSSWQSRNPDAGEYGGAVRVVARLPRIGHVWVSGAFSGLSEQADEAVMLKICWDMRDWDVSAAAIEKIIAISKNTLAERVLAASVGWPR